MWRLDAAGTVTLTARWTHTGGGHEITGVSDGWELTDRTTLTHKETFRYAVDAYDLRGAFTVSEGAVWRAFASADCDPQTEITTRTAALAPGENEIYVLVENAVTYEQTVYTLRLYRNRMLDVPAYFNGTVRYGTAALEENVPASETGTSLPAFSRSGYTTDGKFYADPAFSAAWSADAVVSEETAVYVRAFCHDVAFDGHTVYGLNEAQPGQVHLVLPDGAVEIAAEAFYGNAGLIAVDVPDSVTRVGINAFTGTGYFDNPAYRTAEGVLYAGRALVDAAGTLSGTYAVRAGTASIAPLAFYGCSSLAAVDIPAGVTEIGERAFSYSSIRAVDIPDGVAEIPYMAFADCLSLAEVTLPDTLRKIGYGAFALCSSLAAVEIPAGVTEIGAAAFSQCFSLGAITLPGTLTGIGAGAFTDVGALTVYYMGTLAGWCGFAGAAALAAADVTLYTDGVLLSGELTVPDGVTEIAPYAFYGSGITGLALPDTLTGIGESAFAGCAALTSVTVPDTVGTMGFAAFSGCTNLVSLTLPFVGMRDDAWGSGWFGQIFGAETYEDNAAFVPDGLKSVTLTGGAIIGANAFSGCAGLTAVSLPGTLTEIKDNAFSGCVGLTTLVVPDSVESIGYSAFSGCAGLTSLTLPFVGQSRDWPGDFKSMFDGMWEELPMARADVTVTGGSIGYNAFAGCAALGSVCLGAGVTRISSYAFSDCPTLTDVRIDGAAATIDGGAFSDCRALTIRCTAPARPDGWAEGWNGGCPVVWDCDNNAAADDGRIYVTYGGLRYALYDGGASVAVQPAGIVSADIAAAVVVSGTVYPVTSVAESAFADSATLTDVAIPASVTSIGANAFYLCARLCSVTFAPGSALGTIGANAFSGCTRLTGIDIPASVTDIGEMAFFGCRRLCSVTFGSGSRLANIGVQAFYYCTSLTGITLPASLTGIGRYAFAECVNLLEVYNLSPLPVTAGSADNGAVGLHAAVVHTDPAAASRLTETDGFVFYDDGSVRYLAAYTGAGGAVVLPGGPAYAVRPCVFYERDDIVSVAVSDSVTEIGRAAFYACGGLTAVTFGSGSRLAVIGDSAFENCGRLATVAVPDSVTAIGNMAFYACGSLTAATFGTDSRLTDIGYSAFAGCGLESLYLPAALETAGNGAFRDCVQLTHVRLADGCKRIAPSMFYGCTALKTIEIPDSLAEIGADAFSGCPETLFTKSGGVLYAGDWAVGYDSSAAEITLRPDTAGIADMAFAHCAALTELYIPAGVRGIGEDAFIGCTTLTSITVDEANARYMSADGVLYDKPAMRILHVPAAVGGAVTIPDGVAEIAASAFAGCGNLTGLVIPDSVETIGSYAFSGCAALASVTVGRGVLTAGDGAFRNCAALTEVRIADLGAWCGIAFAGADSNPLAFAGTLYVGGVPVTEAVIPDGVASVGAYAFYGCSALTGVSLPDGLTEIGAFAFADCASLSDLVIPDSVTTVGNSAFFGCDSLIEYDGRVGYVGRWLVALRGRVSAAQEVMKSLTVRDGTVGIIGGAISSGDTNFLTSVFIPDSVTMIGADAFYHCTGLTDATFAAADGWTADGTPLPAETLADPAAAAVCLTDTYLGCVWRRTP